MSVPSRPQQIRYTIGAAFLGIAAALAPLLYGAATSGSVSWLLIIVAISLLLAPAPQKQSTRTSVATILALFALWAIYSIIQTYLSPPAWLGIDLVGEAQQVLGLEHVRQSLTLNPFRFPDAMARGALVAIALISAILYGQDRNIAFRMLFWLVAAALATTILGLALYVNEPRFVLGQAKPAYFNNFTGTFINRGAAGAWLCLMSVAALTLFVRTLHRSIRNSGLSHDRPFTAVAVGFSRHPVLALFLGSSFLIMLAGLLLTESRAAALIFVANLLGFVIILWRLRISSKTQILAATLLLLATLAGTYMFAGGELDERVGKIGLLEQGRVEIWQGTLAGIAERPILGYGAGTFRDFFPMFRPQSLADVAAVHNAHNLPLQLAAESGIFIAFVILIAALSICLSLAGQMLRVRQFDAVKIIGLLSAFSAIGFVTIDVVFETFGYSLPSLVLVGLALGQTQNGDKSPFAWAIRLWRHIRKRISQPTTQNPT